MGKLLLVGLNLGQVFKPRSGCSLAIHLRQSGTKRPNLELKTRYKQLLGSLPLAFTLLSLSQQKSFLASLSKRSNLGYLVLPLHLVGCNQEDVQASHL